MKVTTKRWWELRVVYVAEERKIRTGLEGSEEMIQVSFFIIVGAWLITRRKNTRGAPRGGSGEP
jgi:hypothetical protein